MGFLKKIFRRNDEEKEVYYEETNEQFTDSTMYEESVAEEKEKKFQFPLIEDEPQPQSQPTVEKVFDVQQTENPIFQDSPVDLRSNTYEKKPSNYSPFGNAPNGLIQTVPRVSRDRYNPFTDSGVASEPREPRPPRQEMRPQPEVPKKQARPLFKKAMEERQAQQVAKPEPKKEKPNVKKNHYVAPETSKDAVIPKKRFEPMEVPSPIYGFQKPPRRPIVTPQYVESQREFIRSKKGIFMNNEPTLVEEELAFDALSQQEEVVVDELMTVDLEEPIEATEEVDTVEEIVPEATIEATEEVVEVVEDEIVSEAMIEATEEVEDVVEDEIVSEATIEATEEVEDVVEDEIVPEAMIEATEEVEDVVEDEIVPEAMIEATEEVEDVVEDEIVSEATIEATEEVEDVVEDEIVPEAMIEATEEVVEVVEDEIVPEQTIEAAEEATAVEESISFAEPTTVEGFMAQGLSKEEAEFRVIANRLLKDNVRPFNVELLPSEKKKLQQQKNVEALTNLFPSSPMRPVVTVNSYRKPTSSQTEQVHSPKSMTDEVSSFITEEAPIRMEDVETTEEVHTVIPEDVVYEEEFTQPFYEDESTIDVEDAVEGESFHDVVQTTVEREMTEQQVEMNQATAIAVEDRPQEEVVEDLNNVTGQAPSQQALDLVFNNEPEARIEPNLDHALSYLEPPVEQREDFGWMDAQAERLVRALSDFQIEAEIEGVTQGPTVTQFQLKVGHGVKLNKITNLSDNLKLELAARDIRIEAPIPGKSLIGIEIPNEKTRPVRLSEITETEAYKEAESPLEVALGLGLTGEAVTFDLAKMPHGLIAGSTGSGKSVCINSILVSLLLKTSPQDVKLMLIDPKMVELAVYEDIPHLVSPVITDVKAATAALKWAVEEMERRYTLFHELRVRHISRYNEMMEHKRAFAQKMPYLVIVIDELADLMMQAPQDVEDAICRITQKARACGIHLVVATQRPSVDVITGLIKSNIPTRIAFAVASNVDSRTILDTQGAERLLGKGDMLYLANGSNNPVRLQGTFVTDEEIEDVTDYVRSLGAPNYLFAPEELVKKADLNDKQDELFEAVCRHIVESDGASTSQLQRHFSIGYNRAARLMDSLEEMGYISEARGSKQRDVFLTETDLFDMFG